MERVGGEGKGNRRRKGVCVQRLFLPDVSDTAKHLEQLSNHVMVSCTHRKILLRGREREEREEKGEEGEREGGVGGWGRERERKGRRGAVEG